jgi:hypothetical protein
MKVNSYTYERNWTGKYYWQRLFPSMQTTGQAYRKLVEPGLGNNDGKLPFRKRLFPSMQTTGQAYRKLVEPGLGNNDGKLPFRK